MQEVINVCFSLKLIVTSSAINKKLEIYKNLEIRLEIYKNLEIKLEIYKNLEFKLEIFEFFVNGRWTHYRKSWYFHSKNVDSRT